MHVKTAILYSSQRRRIKKFKRNKSCVKIVLGKKTHRMNVSKPLSRPVYTECYKNIRKTQSFFFYCHKFSLFFGFKKYCNAITITYENVFQFLEITV